jgi:hypothetical protein
MSIRPKVLPFFQYARSINWRLLLFLFLLLDVKLAVKLLALVFIVLVQPGWKMGFRLRNPRLPLFYPAVILIALANFILYSNLRDGAQLAAFFTGLCFWLACILAIHQLKLFVDTNSSQTIINTLLVFFVVNALVSYWQIGRIISETGSFNPYRYQGNYQKYFISTGDYIKGVSFDTSVTNAALNAIGVVFFLLRRNMGLVLLCMSVLLLTASNLTNILLLAVLLFIFIVQANRDQKSMIMACAFMLVIFLARVSPQNNQYLSESYAKFVGHEENAKPADRKLALLSGASLLLGPQEQKEQVALRYLDSINNKNGINTVQVAVVTVPPDKRPSIPEANIHSQPYQHRDDTNETRKVLIDYMQAHRLGHVEEGHLPGKLVAARQTVDFFLSSPMKIFAGTGMGKFSSKLAFRTTGLHIAGSYPKRFVYVDPNFSFNHLSVYLAFFSRPAKLHSVVNSPNSTYLQLLGEYGLLGLTVFLLYLGFFAKGLTWKDDRLPFLLLLLGLLGTDYWFEQLSIIPVFELILLLHLKQDARHA